MNKQQVLDAYASLSPEDQKTVCVEISASQNPVPCCVGPLPEDESSCCPDEFKDFMMQMVGEVDDPSSACKDMMEFCQDMMGKMKDNPSCTT